MLYQPGSLLFAAAVYFNNILMLCQPGPLPFFAAALYFNIILNVVSTRLSTVLCFGLNFQYHSGFCVNQASGAFLQDV